MEDILSSAIQAAGGDSYCITEGKQGLNMVEAYDYYYGRAPEAYTAGGSSYVDRTVWESVNGTLQDLLNVFTSSEDSVRFAPLNSFDADGARAATAMVNKVLLRDNPGYNVLHNVFKEALISRIAFAKRYWHTAVEQDVRRLEHVTEAELAIALSEYDDNNDVNDSMLEVKDNDDGTKTAIISIPVNKSQVKIDFVSAEMVDFDRTASSVKDCSYFRHIATKTTNELIDLGFTEEQISIAGTTSSDMLSEIIADARSRDLIKNLSVDLDDYNKYLVEEIYIRAIPEGQRKTRLYQVWRVNNTIIDFSEVDEIPFVAATPFLVPGSMIGESIFDITKDIQNVKTAITRGYIDNTMNANYGRFIGLKGAYDKRSLLDNRPGGVVDVEAVGAIDLFPYHQLSPGMDNLLEQFNQTAERRTGVTRLGMGLSPEVFKNDNAYATVDMMMSAAQNRMRMIARNFAQNFMTELFLGVYKLLQENEHREVPIEVNGQLKRLQPVTWPDRDKVLVAVAIGANEKKERAQSLLQVANFLTTNPMLANTTFTQENANHLAREFVLAMGFSDVNNYVTPMEEVKQVEPSPQEQLEMQKMQLDMQKIQAEIQEKQGLLEIQNKRADAEMVDAQARMKKQELEEMVAGDKMNIEQAESESRQSSMASQAFVAEASLKFEEQKIELKAIELELRQRELDIRERQIELEAQIEMEQGRSVALSMGPRRPGDTRPVSPI